MADKKNQPEVLSSLIERLIDLEPTKREEPTQTFQQSLRRLRASLRRDLEWLLNTRRPIIDLPEWCHEVENSLLRFGIPDLTSYSLGTARDQSKLIALLEDTIGAFEPRLRNVTVNLLPVNSKARILKFQIEGLLRLESGAERIQFDTTLDLASGNYLVEGNGGA